MVLQKPGPSMVRMPRVANYHSSRVIIYRLRDQTILPSEDDDDGGPVRAPGGSIPGRDKYGKFLPK